MWCKNMNLYKVALMPTYQFVLSIPIQIYIFEDLQT